MSILLTARSLSAKAKGNKDRVTPLTVTLVVPLQTPLEQVRDLAGQELLGLRDVTTTMIYTYTHVVDCGGRGSDDFRYSRR